MTDIRKSLPYVEQESRRLTYCPSFIQNSLFHTIVKNSMDFFFTPRIILELTEIHLETILRLGRDLWEKFRRPSQSRIRSSDYSFESLIKKITSSTINR